LHTEKPMWPNLMQWGLVCVYVAVASHMAYEAARLGWNTYESQQKKEVVKSRSSEERPVPPSLGQ
jgi:hypothetical protein